MINKFAKDLLQHLEGCDFTYPQRGFPFGDFSPMYSTFTTVNLCEPDEKTVVDVPGVSPENIKIKNGKESIQVIDISNKKEKLIQSIFYTPSLYSEVKADYKHGQIILTFVPKEVEIKEVKLNY